MSKEVKSSLLNHITHNQPSAETIPPTSVITDSTSKYVEFRNTLTAGIALPENQKTINAFGAPDITGIPEPINGYGVEVAACKTEAGQFHQEVGQYSFGGDVQLVIETEWTEELAEKSTILGGLSPKVEIIEKDGKKVALIEMFRLDRQTEGVTDPDELQAILDKEEAMTKAIYSQPFKASWRLGTALRDNVSQNGVGIALEAVVDFEKPLDESVIEGAFRKDNTLLGRISARVDLQALVEERDIHLQHFFSDGSESVKISRKNLYQLVVGNMVPQGVLGEMAYILESTEELGDQLPLSMINDSDNLPVMEKYTSDIQDELGLSILQANWYLSFPSLAYFVEEESNISNESLTPYLIPIEEDRAS